MLALKSGLRFLVSASKVLFFGTWKRALFVTRRGQSAGIAYSRSWIATEKLSKVHSFQKNWKLNLNSRTCCLAEGAQIRVCYATSFHMTHTQYWPRQCMVCGRSTRTLDAEILHQHLWTLLPLWICWQKTLNPHISEPSFPCNNFWTVDKHFSPYMVYLYIFLNACHQNINMPVTTLRKCCVSCLGRLL